MASFWVRSALCVTVIIASCLTLVIADYTECQDLPYEPVCGSNNRTYPNECFLRIYNEYSNETYIEKESDGSCKLKDPEAYAENPDFSQPAVEHEIIDVDSEIGPPEDKPDDVPNAAPRDVLIIPDVPVSGFGLPETYPAGYPSSPPSSPVQEPDDRMNPPTTPAVPVYNTQNYEPDYADGDKVPVYY